MTVKSSLMPFPAPTEQCAMVRKDKIDGTEGADGLSVRIIEATDKERITHLESSS